MRRTRSTSKNEPFYMLDRSKTMTVQDFDNQGKLSICRTRNMMSPGAMREHLCGWACSCFLTQLNFIIAGILFLFLIYVVAETTSFFENAAELLTGKPATDNH